MRPGQRERIPYKGEDVVRAVRHAYCHTPEPMESICQRFGVYVSTVRVWRARYGWPKRQGLESRTWRPRVKASGPSRICPKLGRFEYFPPAGPTPRQFRCCDRINTGDTCLTCGHKPAWAV